MKKAINFILATGILTPAAVFAVTEAIASKGNAKGDDRAGSSYRGKSLFSACHSDDKRIGGAVHLLKNAGQQQRYGKKYHRAEDRTFNYACAFRL